jgi:hypothetical protein
VRIRCERGTGRALCEIGDRSDGTNWGQGESIAASAVLAHEGTGDLGDSSDVELLAAPPAPGSSKGSGHTLAFVAELIRGGLLMSLNRNQGNPGLGYAFVAPRAAENHAKDLLSKSNWHPP